MERQYHMFSYIGQKLKESSRIVITRDWKGCGGRKQEVGFDQCMLNACMKMSQQNLCMYD